MKSETARKPTCNVLLVDDNHAVAMLIKTQLSDPNVNVTVSTNGREGIQAFKDGAFDVVLMDLHMPDVDGYEATRAIRFWERLKGLPSTPIRALTGSYSPVAVSELFNSGCDLYLSKPISRNVLLQTVGQYFAASQREQAMAHAAAA